VKRLISIVILLFLCVGCTDADVASRNLAKSADMFELERRIVFYDAIQGVYLLSIEGRCSIEVRTAKLSVTCKTSETGYKKHHLGLSDNVTFFSEQLKSANVGVYNYRVIFKPEVLIPNIDLETSR
jgi:hypothetical protein